MVDDRSPLGPFLRARRERLAPEDAGVQAFGGQRRVAGLRREEVALAAGLSVDHYTRIEQGRQHAVSDDILDSLARVLRLDATERAHLRDLAARPRRRSGDRPRAVRADAGLLRLLTVLDDVPALILGPRSEVLARNGLLEAVLGRAFVEGDSFVDYMFADPSARERIVNWEAFAAATVATLRRESGRRPDDAELAAVIDRYLTDDDQFAAWWDDHRVYDWPSVAKRIAHPVAGELVFSIESVSSVAATDQRLVVYTAEPDSDTARLLPMLASWHGSSVSGREDQAAAAGGNALRGADAPEDQ